jgi:hypothetical protein
MTPQAYYHFRRTMPLMSFISSFKSHGVTPAVQRASKRDLPIGGSLHGTADRAAAARALE